MASLARSLKVLVIGGLMLITAACSNDRQAVGVTTSSDAIASSVTGLDNRPVSGPGKRVVVNLSTFELVAMQDGAPAFRSRVVIGEPTIADAVLDRIVHNAHRLKLKGDSLRKKGATAAPAADRTTIQMANDNPSAGFATWPGSIGIPGRLQPEQVAGFNRKARPTSPEYAKKDQSPLTGSPPGRPPPY